MLTTNGIICDQRKRSVPATIDGLCQKCDSKSALADKLATENLRLRALNVELLAACEKLSDFQRRYEANARDEMPGNDLYAPWLMRIVEEARAAITHAKETTP